MDKIEKIIQAHGGENIKGYSLINNYGYVFYLDGIKYDLRYWANCYGTALNIWRCHLVGGAQKMSDEQRATIKAIEDEANAIGEEVDF